jgi:hypothetical protein
MLRLLRWVGIVSIVMFVGLMYAERGVWSPITSPTDFRAFYCGGRAVVARADPYRVEPAHSCQVAALNAAGFRAIGGLTVPTPQPPYGLAFFSLFAALPFLFASVLWFALSVAAWLRTVFLLRDMTGLGVAWPLFATFGLALLGSLALGQIVPVLMWLVAECAAALHAGDERRAALFATLSTIEPATGGALWLTLFALRPGARRTLALGAVALLAVSLLALRPEQCVEWLTQVLPAHASSELNNPEQFSLSSVLALAGAAPAAAEALGTLDYVAMVVLGIWAAAQTAARWRQPAVIALLPPAFAVLGGPFVHEHHLAMAIPMALLAFAQTRRREFVAAIVLLGAPWFSFAEVVLLQLRHSDVGMLHVTFPPIRPDDLAEAEWANYIAALAAAIAPGKLPMLLMLLFKLPQWLGVALVVVPLLGASARFAAIRARHRNAS